MDEREIVALTDKSTPLEHRKRIMKGLFGQVPILGPFIFEYVTDSKFERLVKFTAELAEDFENYKREVDEEFIRKDEISILVEEIIISSSRTANRDKRRYFLSCFKNTLIKKNVDPERKEYYLNILSGLTSLHLRFLALFAKPSMFNNVGINSEGMYGDGWVETLKKCFPDLDAEIIKSVVTELHRMGLLNSDNITSLTAARGLDLISGRLSALGLKFVEFCEIGG